SATERLVNHLMLLNPCLAHERRRDDVRSVMVAVAGEIADTYLRVRKARLDQPLDLFRVHSHVRTSPQWRRAATALPRSGLVHSTHSHADRVAAMLALALGRPRLAHSREHC